MRAGIAMNTFTSSYHQSNVIVKYDPQLSACRYRFGCFPRHLGSDELVWDRVNYSAIAVGPAAESLTLPSSGAPAATRVGLPHTRLLGGRVYSAGARRS